jgi:crescentin
MARLSNLFGRKDKDSNRYQMAPPVGARRGDGGTEPGDDTFADIGTCIGEENEALRNLLADTGRKIGELNELKQTFDRLVEPFNATLRALEQEKSQTLSLASMLEELRLAYARLRAEFYDVEKRATAAESEGERLREALELAREAARVAESGRQTLADEIGTRLVDIAALERKLAQEEAQHRRLSEAHHMLREQADSAEKRIVELEGALAAAQEKLALLEDEKHSLQLSAAQGRNEAGRLSRRLSETENALTATRSLLGKAEVGLTDLIAERDRLAAALDEAKEQQQTEHNTSSMRIEALQSRAATAERLLAEARQSLIARTEEARGFDRKAVEATIGRTNAEKRLAQIEAVHETRERQLKEVEQARTALAERRIALTTTLKVRESALARAEEKIAVLTERNAQLDAEVQIGRSMVEKRVENLNASLQRERVERAVAEGALETARKDNARLQADLAASRTALRRGPTVEEASVAPEPPANEDALAKPARAQPAAIEAAK